MLFVSSVQPDPVLPVKSTRGRGQNSAGHFLMAEQTLVSGNYVPLRGRSSMFTSVPDLLTSP